MALTIRLSDAQKEVVEKLQAVFDENTASKAILQAAADYLVLRQSFMDLSKRYRKLRDDRNELRDLVEQKQQVCNQIDELERAGAAEYDGEIPPGNDDLLGICGTENLMGRR